MNADQLFGALVGLILGVVGNYLFEGLGFKTRAAKLSSKRASARLSVLEKRLDETERYLENPVILVNLVAGRLLLVTFLWIAQSAIDYLLGLLTNGVYTFRLFVRSTELLVDPDVLSTSVSTAGSAVGALLLLITAKLALDVYVIWRRVHRIDKYRPKVEAEVTELLAVLQGSATGRPEQESDRAPRLKRANVRKNKHTPVSSSARSRAGAPEAAASVSIWSTLFSNRKKQARK